MREEVAAVDLLAALAALAVAVMAHRVTPLGTRGQLIRVVVVVALMTKAVQVKQVVRVGLA